MKPEIFDCFGKEELFKAAVTAIIAGAIDIKARILEVTQKKKDKGIKLLIKETKEILHATNKSSKFSMLCITSLVLFIGGAFITVAMSNMLPVLAVGFALLLLLIYCYIL